VFDKRRIWASKTLGKCCQSVCSRKRRNTSRWCLDSHGPLPEAGRRVRELCVAVYGCAAPAFWPVRLRVALSMGEEDKYALLKKQTSAVHRRTREVMLPPKVSGIERSCRTATNSAVS
jgi:hypothetical protein